MTKCLYCWNCKNKNIFPSENISFHAVCESCGFDLHVCKNCKYYSIGKPNECNISNTEYVSDREKYNFCEDFKPLEKVSSNDKKNASDVEKKLFKDAKNNKNKKTFDSLFDD